ncbi:unnamed protein product, partial [Ectocarpus sp. 8 AP-2014]
MGVGVSACKGLVHPQAQDPTSGDPERSLSTVTRLPFLSAFEDRPPFKPSEALSDRDASLLKALTHHRTPFAVVETDSTDLNVIYASGGCVAGMGMPAENIEGSSLAGVLKKGIKMLDEDIARLEVAVRAKEPYRFRRAWTCLKPSSVWSLFTPYKTLCEADAGLIHALQDRREMFCITDPDLYDNPIS